MGVIGLLLLGLVLGWAWMVQVTARALARPNRRTYAWAVSRSRPADPSELPTPRTFQTIQIKHNTIESGPAWLIDGDRPDGPVVIFCHGWGETKMDILQRLDAVLPHCSRIISWDMPGHGDAPQGPTPLGTSEWLILEDLVELAQGEDLDAREREAEELEATLEDEAAWEAHFDKPPMPGAPKVIIWGYSLGAGIAIDLVANRTNRVSAVIAESPYRLAATPARNMLILKRLPWRLTLGPAMFLLGISRHDGPRWTGFDRASLVRDAHCPILVIHGDADEISPPADGAAIARAAGTGEVGTSPSRGTFVPLPGATHFDLWLDPARADARAIATDAIRDLIQSVS